MRTPQGHGPDTNRPRVAPAGDLRETGRDRWRPAPASCRPQAPGVHSADDVAEGSADPIRALAPAGGGAGAATQRWEKHATYRC